MGSSNYKAEWRKLHPDKVHEYARRSYHKHRDRRKAYLLRNHDKIVQKRRVYMKENREAILVMRRAWKRKRLYNIKGFAKKLHEGVKIREKSCNLTVNDIIRMWTEQDKKCALTGIIMQLGPSRRVIKGRIFADWDKCSIDRIDCLAGYNPGNVRLVCYWANVAKNTLTDEQFVSFCRMVIKHA